MEFLPDNENNKVFAWIFEKDQHVWVNVKCDAEWISFWRNAFESNWKSPTHILYADKDNLTSRQTVDEFADHFQCELTVMHDGEHWFHTPEQLAVLNRWAQKNL